MLLFIGLFLGCGLLTMAIARPLILRRVPPNQIYGVRFSATYADEWVWYEANEASGRDFLKWGAAQVAAAILPLAVLRPTSWDFETFDRRVVVYLAINMIAMLGGLLVVSVIGYLRAKRLLRERVASGAALKPKPAGL